MPVSSKSLRRMGALAGIVVLATAASAAWIPSDAKIQIDRALNSPTLTIRYEGANATLVELRINGESMGTRSVVSGKSSGETNFKIDLSQLKDGDNEVEVRLYDRTGKLVGTDKTNISTDQSEQGPVFLKTPKVGATVQGPVEISLGFGREMKDAYVSFFVDSNFKKMTNYPPYVFSWDTVQEVNGWHEVEAWVIDGSSTTYKTRKTRIFVNNPGGRTDRVGVATTGTPKANPIHAEAGGATGPKEVGVTSTGVASGANSGAMPPSVGSSLTPNRVKASIGGSPSSAKIASASAVEAAGPRTMTPRVALNGSTGTATVAVNPTPTPKLIPLKKGSRLGGLTTFAVVFNSEFVNFDVAPRVDEGVPMTPVRYLLEKAGGKVDWKNGTKTMQAKADGKAIRVQIGDSMASINDLSVTLERPAYIDRGRTIVPLSFLHDALNVDIEFDKETGHVLITSASK